MSDTSALKNHWKATDVDMPTLLNSLGNSSLLKMDGIGPNERQKLIPYAIMLTTPSAPRNGFSLSRNCSALASTARGVSTQKELAAV